MKKLAFVVMAVGLFGAMPAMAAEQAQMNVDEAKECVRACVLESESIQQKIKRIQGEIEKGSTKYSVEELKKLEKLLKEANETLDSLNKR